MSRTVKKNVIEKYSIHKNAKPYNRKEKHKIKKYEDDVQSEHLY